MSYGYNHLIIYFFIVINSGRDASHILRLHLYHTVMIPAAPQDIVGETGMEPGIAGWQPVVSAMWA
jgi:hypothetical protein